MIQQRKPKAVPEKKQRKEGSGRKPMLPEALAAVDRPKLRSLIDLHDGVISKIVGDDAGLRACRLVFGENKLSRVTLSTRLSAILGVAPDSAATSALDYANSVRVRSGKPGPRSGKVAKATQAEVESEQRRVIDVLARSPSLAAAAATLRLSPSGLRGLRGRLLIKESAVQARKKEILTCPACGPTATRRAEHSCGLQSK